MDGNDAPLVAHVIHRLDIGGLENGLVNLINRFPRDPYRHAIVCLAESNPAFQRRIEREDVEVVSLGKQRGKDPAVYARMWAALRRMKPAIVHTRNLGTVDMQWVAAAAGVPHRVHGEHGWEASDPTGLSPRHLRIRRACRPVIHRYVPMSRDLARWLETDVGVDRLRIRQLYNGVDTHRFAPSSAQLGEDQGNGFLTIGTVGRLDPIKNQASLIEVLARLRLDFPRLRLLIVGEGPLRGQLEAQTAELGLGHSVTFAGARSDMPALLRTMDVFVLPSLNEGISNTILEAMATGLPVVAGRVGGNPELVLDGITGALYETKASGALEGALVPYLRDAGRRSAHGRAGRDRVVQNFSMDQMVQRYQALYDELLAATSPHASRASLKVRGQ
jgi:sugar transferase (PEP-CTERM/EpsH1 system associated)